jgi:hypothetical protein
MALLPEELREYLPSNLEDNKANFPEFAQPVDRSELLHARDSLLRLKLVHYTRPRQASAVAARGLAPVSQLGEDLRANTHAIDYSLGLQHAIFWHWGDLYREPVAAWVLAQPELLYDDATVVTPKDIVDATWTQSDPFDALSPDQQAAAKQEYFDKMLMGVDWLELQARRMVLGNSALTAVSLSSLGEVKMFRAVGPDEIRVTTDPAEKQALQMEAQALGFVDREVAYPQDYVA